MTENLNFMKSPSVKYLDEIRVDKERALLLHKYF